MEITPNDLQELLDNARSRHGVVGASLGVLQNGTIEVAASGLLNLNTKVKCTPDSVFQIGSISKVFTATLIMQLVDDGRLDLTDPVIKYLPDFRIADVAASRSVTVGQLLNHTCGMDGDFFPPDDPEGPSTLSYLRKMCLLGSIYPPGKGPMTYSNSGYVVAGRIIEVLTGMTWQHAVMTRICEPLKMPAAFAHPQEALRFRCAMGHTSDPRNPKLLTLARHTFLPISMAPAGSVLTMSAESLLLFGKAHLENRAYSGARLLSVDSAQKMRNHVVPVPPFSLTGIFVTHWGIGWFLGQEGNYRMVGHDGSTQGHYAYLRVFPEKGTAFAVLTNSASTKMFQEIEEYLTESIAGASVPSEPPPEPVEPQVQRYVGLYRSAGASCMVVDECGTLRMSISPNQPDVLTHAEICGTLDPYRSDVFQLKNTNSPIDNLKVVFVDSDKQGHAMYVRWGGRMIPSASLD